MEISIKNSHEIEEVADEIIALEEITTNTTEVKTKIINLITDKLYHSIKNVSLSTIIKDQLETPQITKKNSQTVTTKPAKESVKETVTKPINKDMTKVTPEEIFGKKPTDSQPAKTAKKTTEEQSEAASQHTKVDSQSTTKSAEKPVQAPSTPFPMVDTTIKDDEMPLSDTTPDPLTQYQQNNKAQSGNITYNGTNYNYAVKRIKRGPLAGKDAIVVEYHVPASINNQIINNPQIKQEIEDEVKALNAKYEGQTPSFYNAVHSLAFVIATENSLNDYVNDLDMIMHVIQNKTNAFA